MREGRQRHQLVELVGDVDALERLGPLPVLRRDFHDDVVLVLRLVDVRDEALAEGVVQGDVDGGLRHAQTCGGVTVYDQRQLQALVLLVAVDVLQLRQGLQHFQDARRPIIQLGEAVALQCVLVLRIRPPAAGLDVLIGLQEQRRAGDLGQLGAQAIDYVIGADLAFGERFQRHVDAAGVALGAAAGAAAD